ncbi:MAG: dihydrofolate reductase family protein [Solirubrobacteraceae bacterium]
MRKIAAIENVTLDGFADSQEGLGFEWTARAYDDEVDRYSNEYVRADVDTAMYGRATYLGMQGFWSKMLDSPNGTPTQRAHAEWVNHVDKVVFSTTLESAGWANSRLMRGNVAEEVATLKARPGGTIAIYASPKLVHRFVDLGLIDEFRILVHPVTLGRGTPLFHDKAKLDLELLESRSFDSGAFYVRYQVL